MIKRIAILRRLEGMSREAFMKHWQAHLPMAHEVPGLRRYVLDFIVDQPQRPGMKTWDIGEVDGIAETWFDDHESAARAFASPEGKRWLAHGATFISQQMTFVIDEQVVIPKS